jgi:hypothetical protein
MVGTDCLILDEFQNQKAIKQRFVRQYTKNMRIFNQIQVEKVEVLPDHNENNILTMQE